MNPEYSEYKGHRIELREHEGAQTLMIDHVPVRYGRFDDGMYYLHEYAYDPSDNLVDLARKYIDYRERSEENRGRQSNQNGGQKNELP